MADSWVGKYIPAGSLIVSEDNAGVSSVLCALAETRIWIFLTRPEDNACQSISIPEETQAVLLASTTLKPFVHMWRTGWIRMSILAGPSANSNTSYGIRFYILPHDIDRRIKTPGNELFKAASTLLCQLDYNRESWNAESHGAQRNEAVHRGNPDVSRLQDISLLDMFNSVPSPSPELEKVSDADTRYAMLSLLESKMTGLKTPLYSYQGRSAAMMLQRELDPGRIVDPRFVSALDQSGDPWYFDNVTGLVLKEPRYYDGACGGILAEEMGTGKTLICLALILVTKSEPTHAPEPFVAETPERRKVASLMDMTAAAINRSSIAWKPYFDIHNQQYGHDYENCVRSLTKNENRASYKVRNTLVEPRRSNRTTPRESPPKQVYLSYSSLIVVPNNLVKQWLDEIKKHTTGLNVLTLVDKTPIPSVTELLAYDIILFSENRFELIQKERSVSPFNTVDVYCPLEHIRFRRCIIDEGHKLGNRGRAWKSDIMRVLDRLEISARWVVTGTPSRGLYGVDQHQAADQERTDSVIKQEREDLQRIGNITAKYLKVRPWANTRDEVGDSVADWNVYVMHPKQHTNGRNRKDCLKSTLDSLMVRHRLQDVKVLLPQVNEQIVILDGSYQDQLSLNLFSMMIIFNSVQSQRTDMDYFFHERQRKSLLQLVKNLRQASFFGGVFYSPEHITKALDTAEGFLEKKVIPISSEDEDLLREAVAFGKIAVQNRLKDLSNRFHTMPLYVKGFPGGNGKSWSLDEHDAENDPVCTDAGMIHSLQKFLNPCIDAPTSLQLMIDSGRLDQQGAAERSQALVSAMEAASGKTTQVSNTTILAGNTALGDDHHSKPKSGLLKNVSSILNMDTEDPKADATTRVEIAEPLAKTQIISTVSAKLSYLIDSIIKYQDDEQIIVFYENDNIAYYLAGVLEILQIQHLIYARAGLSAERRAQYVATFTRNPKFRVLLMDISQAAFGLDMRSASRIYFISPVLNPQVEAQAIGRARRISQQRPVTVETLVLRNSIEEIIVARRKTMTQAEHSRVKTVLDDRKIYEWILNAKINPMTPLEDGVAQTAMLETPQYIFGRGFGRELDPDEDLVTNSPETKTDDSDKAQAEGTAIRVPFKVKRGGLKRSNSPLPSADISQHTNNGETSGRPQKKRARIAWADQDA